MMEMHEIGEAGDTTQAARMPADKEIFIQQGILQEEDHRWFDDQVIPKWTLSLAIGYVCCGGAMIALLLILSHFASNG
jgi:hypothetical protein